MPKQPDINLNQQQLVTNNSTDPMILPQAALFDFDGTLGDSTWVWLDVDRVFLEKRGFVCDEEYIAKIRTTLFLDGARYTIERFNLPETPEEVVAEWFDLALDRYTHEVPLKPGVLEYLTKLKDNNIPFGIVTSSVAALCYPVLERYGIVEWFDFILTADDVPVSKTNPDVFLKAAELLDATPNNIAIYEDNIAAIRTAAKAGFLTVGVHDEHIATEWPFIKQEADWTIVDYGEAMNALHFDNF